MNNDDLFESRAPSAPRQPRPAIINPCSSDRGIQAILDHAATGDTAVLLAVRNLLKKQEYIDRLGDLASIALERLIRTAAGDNLAVQEGIRTKYGQIRAQLLADCDAGLPTKAVAEKYSVSRAWVRRLKQRRREDGRIEPRSTRNKRVRTLDAHLDRLRELIAATPDLTLEELREELGVTVAIGTMWAAVARLGMTVKKKRIAPRSKTART
jgi:transposase